jgi:hypothetical protein
MGHSKIPVVISLFSLLAAAGSVAALFSIRAKVARDGPQVKAASYLDDSAGSHTAVSIEPEAISYRQTAEFAVDLKKVTGLSVDDDGRIYVTGDMCVCRYSPDGLLGDRIALSFEPTCVAIGNRQHIAPGRIYVGFADHVEVFDPDGSKVAIWQGIDKARFTSISASDHDVFIADDGWNVVQHFDTTGKLLSPIGENNPGRLAPSPGGGAEHFDLVVGRDGLVYVVNRRDCCIEGYNASGEVERHWGQASPALEDFAGRNNPEQIALTDGGFATAEEDPMRVKVYSRAGTLAGVVCGPKEVGRIADLAADRHNRILVLDSAANRVRIFEEKKAATAK